MFGFLYGEGRFPTPLRRIGREDSACAKGLGNTLLHIPKPMSENPKSKSFGWPFWLVLTLIVFLLAGLTAPMTIRCRKKPEQTEATSA